MKRNERLSVEVSRAIASAISEVFPLDISGVFTVREVHVLQDLSEARVRVSRIGGAKDFFEKLASARGVLQKKTFAKIPLRVTPKLIFFEDFTGEYAQDMEEKIKQYNADFRIENSR